MNKKLKSTLGLVALLLLLLLVGGIYIFLVQRGKLNEKKAKLTELNQTVQDPEELQQKYQNLVARSQILDSILSSRKFNIPQSISSIKFFNFINSIVASFPEESQVNIEYVGQKPEKEFFAHEYKISGGAYFNDAYHLIYAIEQSKELKKIPSMSFSNLIKTDEDGIPLFMVNFEFNVLVYFSSDNRFAPAEFVENNLSTGPIYDVFYPLIRNEIPPNIDNLLDVQGAKLLALIPEGAFVADTKGNTYLVWEGEQVYLGYLTKIDYNNNTVGFILNKGGIIEKVTLELDRTETKK